MARYRNPKHAEEDKIIEGIEAHEDVMKTPAVNVEEETWKKRYGDQRRYVDSVKAESKAKLDELERKLDMALRGQIKAPKSNEDVEAWMQQYPEFAGILETIVQQRIREATSTTDQKLAKIEEKSAELEKEKAILALRKLHPDFDELVKSQDFHTWLTEQDQDIQNAIYKSLNVKRADFVIKMYKADTKPTSDDDDTFTSASAARKVRSTRVADEPIEGAGDYDFTESQIERLGKKDRNWYSKNEDKIMDAMRRGKVLMDISGGAR